MLFPEWRALLLRHSMNYLRYYDLETYLLEEVGPQFRDDGQLSAFDFFCIVVWKSNRAKSRIAKRLLERGHADLEEAVAALCLSIQTAPNRKARFLVLCKDYGFRLPMASAILTILYPEDFTVYDVRVCEVFHDFRSLADRTDPERLWEGYEAYVSSVRAAVPEHEALRDKDRHLWARSFAEGLRRDIERRFGY